MGRLLLKTAVLLAVALAAGFAHSRVGPKLLLHVQEQLPRPLAGEGGGQKPPTGPTAATGQHEVKWAADGDLPKPQPEGATGTTGQVAAKPAPPPPPPPDGLFISLAKAKELLDHGDAVFVDARPYDDFKAGHVLGAVHIDKKYFDGAAGADIAKKNLMGQRVVVYCHGADCTDSEAVAKRLIALNLNIGPVHIIKEGFPGWKAAGYPVEQGG